MEDSFKVRVDKVFGSLLAANNTPSSSFPPSLWSLSDDEIEKKEWNRGTPSTSSPPPLPDPFTHPYPTDLNPNRAAPPPNNHHLADFEQLQSDIQELDDVEEEEDDEEEDHRPKPKHKNDDEQAWEKISYSVGLDCTLDFEEEEDEYDKVAVGREKDCDRIYMRDMIEYGIGANAHHELPNSFKQVTRDPRANRAAAKLRLREDAEAAGDFHSLKLSDIPDPYAGDIESYQSENGILPKPILKKRENSMDEKSTKRVRFQEQSLVARDSDVGSISTEETSSLGQSVILPHDQSLVLDTEVEDEAAGFLQKPSCEEADVSNPVPDYLRNPTKYTRYTLDMSSNDMDEASNQKAYMDFFNLMKKRNMTKLDVDESSSLSFQHPLIFTPRKKLHYASLMEEDELNRNQHDKSKNNASFLGIAAGDIQDAQDSAMEEDEIETVDSGRSQKRGRHYRNRNSVDFDDHDTNVT